MYDQLSQKARRALTKAYDRHWQHGGLDDAAIATIGGSLSPEDRASLTALLSDLDAVSIRCVMSRVEAEFIRRLDATNS